MPEASTESLDRLRETFADCLASGETLPPAAEIARIRRFCEPIFQQRYSSPQARLHDIEQLEQVAGAHASPEQLARFSIESQAVAQLQHPGIVQIYEVGEHDGLPYFSLEFVAGGSLANKIGGKSLSQTPRCATSAKSLHPKRTHVRYEKFTATIRR